MLWLITAAHAAPWALTFSNGNDDFTFESAMNQDAEAVILSASSSVELAVYNLTDQGNGSVTEALIDRHQALGAGAVRVIVDGENRSHAAVQALVNAGIEVRDDGGDTDEMHDKFIVVDGDTVWTSTANFTDPGFSSQDNLALRLDDAIVAGVFRDEFDEMWNGTWKENSPPSTTIDFALTDGSPVRVLFGADDDPIDDVFVGLRSYVGSATESVHISIYTFTGTVGDGWSDLSDDLLTAHNDGLVVRGVLDRDLNAGWTPYEQRGGAGPQMDERGMDMRLDAHAALHHDKLAVIDQEVLVVGSANFTYSADAFNDENVVFLEHPGAARKAVKWINWHHGLATDEGTPASPPADRTAPATLTGVSLADAPGSGRITVDWTASGASDLSRYHVFLLDRALTQADLDFRSLLNPVTTVRAGATWPVQVTALSDGRPIPDGTGLYAAVVATDHAGNESPISTAGPVTSIDDTDDTPPVFAGIQSLVAASPTALDVGWNAATDDGSPASAIVYRVYVATTTGGQNFSSPAAQTAPGALSASLTGLTPSTPYHVVVRAVDGAGNEDGNTVERSVTTCDASESCNGIDDDCDGLVDEGLPLYTAWPDADGDGYGDASASASTACAVSAAEVTNALDCDDSNAAVNPAATEVTCDGLDNDCVPGTIDGEDLDGDGRSACVECDDTDPNSWITCTTCKDADGDGFWYGCDAYVTITGPDCDDATAARYPGRVEVCDGLDNDCNGLVDDQVPFADWWPDGDGDGYGDATVSPVNTCAPPAGHAGNGDDCDDSRAAVNPGAPEQTCDTLDNDCDPATADTVDADSDGVDACTDCDDADPDNFPGNLESCDSADNDCNAVADDGVVYTDWYADTDGDGYGSGTPTNACQAPADTVADGTDCDDSDATVHPGAYEIGCDSIDNDCDGGTPDGTDGDGDGTVCGDCDDTDPDNWASCLACTDADGDGSWMGCDAYTTRTGPDCDDGDPDNQTGCSTCLDSDSDGFFAGCDAYALTDGPDCSDANANVWNACTSCGDQDGDGWYAACDAYDTVTGPDCDDTDSDNWLSCGGCADLDGDGAWLGCDAYTAIIGPDCDDADPLNAPHHTEGCDGRDNDCDGEVDEALVFEDWVPDDDGDGFGDATATPVTTCAPVAGHVQDARDCDDTRAGVNPATAEQACDGLDNDCNGATPDQPDADGDGVSSCTDCDDADANNHPGNPEQCDARDNDCDTVVDNGVTYRDWWADADGDGFGAGAPVNDCVAPIGGVANATDCDDTDAAVNPAAAEVACDGADNDCAPSTADAADIDQDGVSSCSDCDDTDAFNWSACAVCADLDGDGWFDGCDSYGAGLAGPDCDDADATVSPSAFETCDGRDEDCDGTADNGVVNRDWWPDADGDGVGDAAATPTNACAPPSGYVATHTDCDDTDATVRPGRTEDACNGVDDDCDPNTVDAIDADGDGVDCLSDCDDADFDNDQACSSCTDSDGDGWFVACDRYGTINGPDCDDTDASATENTDFWVDADGDGFGASSTTPVLACPTSSPSGTADNDADCDDTRNDVHPTSVWHADRDQDGFGDPLQARRACLGPPGWVLDATDCNDGSPTIHPAATELCNGTDDDCDGSVDEGAVGGTPWYADLDGDGYGNPAASVVACTAPADTVANDADCDDSSAANHPNAVEQCDNVDNDCDGAIDTGVATSDWFLDADGDGYGTGAAVSDCKQPSGHVLLDGDCDDGDDSRNPGATEICNNIDDDCNAAVDDGAGGATWFPDGDGDGWGTGSGVVACQAPSDHVAAGGDCNDSNTARHPGADEVCNGFDDDCDGALDDDPVDGTLWYYDVDQDGFAGSSSIRACVKPAGTYATATDCWDLNGGVHPGATERACDTWDNDCNPATLDDPDADGDGWGACSGDCDDADDASHPGASEVCDRADNDCDGNLPSDEQDPDSDNVTACEGDCAPTDSAVRPGLLEVCGNGVDEDCSGAADDLPDNDNDGANGCLDCDDNDPQVFPGQVESCNGKDDDCSGDESTDEQDSDGDGLSPCDGDCDDSRASVRPGVTEQCDGLDNDCDGAPLPTEVDSDGDGVAACEGDCNDDDPDTWPGAEEPPCEGKDRNCDGIPGDLSQCDGPSTGGDVSEKGGCGCATSQPTAGWLIGLLAWLRRRPDAK